MPGLNVIRSSENNFWLAADLRAQVLQIHELDARLAQRLKLEFRARSRNARDVMICFNPASWQHASIVAAPVE